MRISDGSSDVCSSDLEHEDRLARHRDDREDDERGGRRRPEQPREHPRQPCRGGGTNRAYDLGKGGAREQLRQFGERLRDLEGEPERARRRRPDIVADEQQRHMLGRQAERRAGVGAERDRKSVVTGTSVSVRVDLGGRGIITRKIITTRSEHSDISIFYISINYNYPQLP